MNKLSILMITKNAGEVVEDALKSVEGLWDELLIADDGSTDDTVMIAKRYGARVYASRGKNLGERKQWLVEKATGDWVLILDSDERVSSKLYKQIQGILSGTKDRLDAYSIPYQNHVLGRPVHYGGESYRKTRLFRRTKGSVEKKDVHEEVVVNGAVGTLSGTINHHSFRSIPQILGKFTRYARDVAREKQARGERVTLTKLFLYGPHLFWVRYVREDGHKDGIHGFILAKSFGYMEGLTYWFLLAYHTGVLRSS